MKKTYNPFKIWSFWLFGILGAVGMRLLFGKGHFIQFFNKCVPGLKICTFLGISMNAVYGLIGGFLLGYILYIAIKKR